MKSVKNTPRFLPTLTQVVMPQTLSSPALPDKVQRVDHAGESNLSIPDEQLRALVDEELAIAAQQQQSAKR